MLPLLPLANTFFSSFIYIISLLTMLIASFIALRQIDIKKIIAYSSIAHMSLGFLGLFSGNIYGVCGAIFLMVCHGFVSTGLFFMAGLLYERFFTRQIFEYGGLCTTMPLFTFFFFFTLANIGLPGFGNFHSRNIIIIWDIFKKRYFNYFTYFYSFIFNCNIFFLIIFKNCFWSFKDSIYRKELYFY